PAASWACSRSEAAPKPDPALFDPVASVLTHPRCINCHQDQTPAQTDRKIPHRPLVIRGAEDHGAPTLPCQSCHQDTNTASGGFVPGAPGWRLAPLVMLWEGKTKAQICAQIKDPVRNGGMNVEKLKEHVRTDAFVHWAWAPGGGRTTPPLSHAKFVEAWEAWIGAGMPCP